MTVSYSADLASNYANSSSSQILLPVISWPGGIGTFSWFATTYTNATVTLLGLTPDPAESNAAFVALGVDVTKTGPGFGSFTMAPCRLRLAISPTVAGTFTVSGLYARIARVQY